MNDDERAEQIRSEQIQRLEELVAGPTGAMAFPLLAEAHRHAGRPEDAERVAREGLGRSPQVAAGRVALALALLDQKRDDEVRSELERLLGADPEHAIAGDAAARVGAEGLSIASPTDDAEPRTRGEIATLDPYPFGESLGEGDRAASAAMEEREPTPSERAPDAGPFGAPPPPAAVEPLVFDGASVEDDELDDAFAQAESDHEQMLGADDVAQAALAMVPDEEEYGGFDEEHPRSFVDAVTTATDTPFATETVAGLLEQQGHGEDAEALRAHIEAPASSPPFEADENEPSSGNEGARPEAPSAAEPRSRATLERWLDNLRRDRP